MAHDSERTIDHLRNNLSEKLAEIHRRAVHTRAVLSPSTYWKNPWVRLGLGAVVGFAIGDLRRTAVRTHEGLGHMVVRSALGAAVTALVTRAITVPRDPGQR